MHAAHPACMHACMHSVLIVPSWLGAGRALNLSIKAGVRRTNMPRIYLELRYPVGPSAGYTGGFYGVFPRLHPPAVSGFGATPAHFNRGNRYNTALSWPCVQCACTLCQNDI